MKFKDLLLPLGFSLLTVIFINKFFFKSSDSGVPQGVQSGQRFTAPKQNIETKLLNTEIDFIDEKRSRKMVLTEVETDLARFVFSNEGASLERLEMKREINGKEGFIHTIYPVGQNEKEDKCFLVALNEKTPYFYEFAGKEETESEVRVRYRYASPASDVHIKKTYTIFKETHKLNLTVEVAAKKSLENGVEPRIFFPSPFSPEIPGGPFAVIENNKKSVERTGGSSINEQNWWASPSLLGADNKYFSHVLIEDPDKFVQRGYYREPSAEKLFSILEGPTVEKNGSWTLSFYFGPKEDVAMGRVDARLEQTLDYSGWLAPISKLLLAFLKYLYKYLGNYGLAIIVLTLLMRLLLLPFTMKADQGMKKRVELQKKMKYVEQKYKHDKDMLAQAKADLIRKHGLPGLGGCLPMLLQVPIFFSLSRVLSSSIEFYKAPFFLWITDLSAADPYYILPMVMSGAMILQGLLGDKNMRFPLIVMGLLFGAFLSNLSAGLGLYLAISTLLGLLQTTLQKRLRAV